MEQEAISKNYIYIYIVNYIIIRVNLVDLIHYYN